MPIIGIKFSDIGESRFDVVVIDNYPLLSRTSHAHPEPNTSLAAFLNSSTNLS